MSFQAKGVLETYELLCILDFNNVRKRMSVILKKDGKIRLYCKGADSIIYERLKDEQEGIKYHTQEHLDVSIISHYLAIGVLLILKSCSCYYENTTSSAT